MTNDSDAPSVLSASSTIIGRVALRSRFLALVSPTRWELYPYPSTFAEDTKSSNKDLDPTPPAQQTWTTWSFVALWVSESFNATAWETASAAIAIGLSWSQALTAIAVGSIFIALAVTANGTIGARLHVSFPVLARSSFGFYFSYFAVLSRVILAMFWFGIQTYTGSECLFQMIKAIWPSFAKLPNQLPESAHITSAGLISYFLFWTIQFPFLLISPQNVRYFFMIKTLIVPPAFVAMMVWAFIKTGDSDTTLLSRKGTLHDGTFSWAWLAALNSVLGGYATLAVNIPDFTRYAPRPRDQYVQLIVIPIAITFVAFIGIVVTSAGNVLYGTYLWDPLHLIDRWDNRPAAFFASFAFALATLGTNISANSISAANDLTALLPRFINIHRGQIICAFIGGWAVCPWEILASALGFLTFMRGYTIVLSPICSIMIFDYWVVQKRAIDIPALYRPLGKYRYLYGCNWRVAITLLITVALGLPGLINDINHNIHVPAGLRRIFEISYILEFFVAGIMYTGLSFLFPQRDPLVHDTRHTDTDLEERGIRRDMLYTPHAGRPSLDVIALFPMMF